MSETPVKFYTGNQKYQEFTKLGYNYAQNKKRRKTMKTMQVLNISKTKIDVVEVPAYTLGVSNEHMFAKAVNSLRIKDEKSKIEKSLNKINVRNHDVRKANYNPVKVFDDLDMNEYDIDSSVIADDCEHLKLLDEVSKGYLYDGEIPDFIKVRASLYIAAIDGKNTIGMAIKDKKLVPNPINFGAGSTDLYDIALEHGTYGINEDEKKNKEKEFVEALKVYAKQYETQKGEFTDTYKYKVNKRVVNALLTPLAETLDSDRKSGEIGYKRIMNKDKWLCVLARALFKMPEPEK